MKKERCDLWVHFDIDGYPFEMCADIIEGEKHISIRHRGSSLSGFGSTYADAFVDMIEMAKEVGPLYLDLKPGDFYGGAAALFEFQKILGHFVAYKTATRNED